MIHGWYSEKQKKQIQRCNDTKKYLYYKDMEDNIVEVTVVSSTMEHNCKFDDMIYVGKLKKFYKRSDTELI